MEDSPYGILVNLLANHVAIVDETLYYHRVYHSGSTMTKVHEGEKNPNIPYRGMREAAEMLKKVFSSPPKSDIAEYMKSTDNGVLLEGIHEAEIENSMTAIITANIDNKELRKNFDYRFFTQKAEQWLSKTTLKGEVG